MTDWQGLDLAHDIDEVPGDAAIDLLNMDFDRLGSLRTRDGTSVFASPVGSTAVKRLAPFYRSADQLMAHYTVSGGSKVTAFSNAGVAVATQAMNGSGSVCDFASVGTASQSRAYVCDSGGLMYRWDGAAFTQVAGSPKCSYVVQSGIDNRLVAANIATLPTGSGASAASSSLVHFSDPGAPETWSANNYEYLTPGDGDPINAVVSWRELVFVFKRFRFFVFTGTSTDGTGNPIFNYRTVDNHVGVQSPFAAVAAPEGVYFAAQDGIYLTTGQSPTRISDSITPWFTGQLSSYWTGSGTSSTNWGDGTNSSLVWGDGTGTDTWGGGPVTDVRLAYANHRLYVFSTGQNDCFVYTPAQRAWTYWSFPQPNSAMCGFQLGAAGPEILMLGQPQNILQADKNATTDAGTQIAWRYRSGFFAPFGFPVVEITSRRTILEGIGSATFGISRDYGTTIPTTDGGAQATVTMGTGPTPAKGYYNVAQRAARFSYQISGTAAARLNSLTLMVTAPRAPGLQTAQE